MLIDKKIPFFIFVSFLAFSSCKKNPVNRLINPIDGGVVPDVSGTYTIFDDELKTTGGAGLFPGGDNQVLSFADATSPRRSINQIYYRWNGGDVISTSTSHSHAGFSLIVTPNFSTYDSATGRNLAAITTYSKLKFYIRGSLSSDTTLKIEGPSDGTSGFTPASIVSGTDFTLTSDWQEITIDNIPAADFNNVKAFITVTFLYSAAPRTTAPGNGGTIYLDDIRYEQ